MLKRGSSLSSLLPWAAKPISTQNSKLKTLSHENKTQQSHKILLIRNSNETTKMNPEDVLDLDGGLPPVVAEALRLNYWPVKDSNLVAFLLMSFIDMKNKNPAIISADLNFRETKKQQVEEHGNNSLCRRLNADGSYIRTVFNVYEALLLGYKRKGGAAARQFAERNVLTDITDKWNSGGDLEAIFPEESVVKRAIKLLDPDESIRKNLGDELLSNLPLTAVYCHVVSLWSSTTFLSWNNEEISA